MGRARPGRGTALPVRRFKERIKKSMYLKTASRVRLMQTEEATAHLAAFRFWRSKKRLTSFPWIKSTNVEKRRSEIYKGSPHP